MLESILVPPLSFQLQEQVFGELIFVLPLWSWKTVVDDFLVVNLLTVARKSAGKPDLQILEGEDLEPRERYDEKAHTKPGTLYTITWKGEKVEPFLLLIINAPETILDRQNKLVLDLKRNKERKKLP